MLFCWINCVQWTLRGLCIGTYFICASIRFSLAHKGCDLRCSHLQLSHQDLLFSLAWSGFCKRRQKFVYFYTSFSSLVNPTNSYHLYENYHLCICFFNYYYFLILYLREWSLACVSLTAGVMNSLFSVYGMDLRMPRFNLSINFFILINKWKSFVCDDADIYDDLISRRDHSSDAEKFAEVCPWPCNGVGWGVIWWALLPSWIYMLVFFVLFLLSQVEPTFLRMQGVDLFLVSLWGDVSRSCDFVLRYFLLPKWFLFWSSYLLLISSKNWFRWIKE